MKNSIKLSALFLLFSTGLFAAVPAKPGNVKASSINRMVTFSTLPSKRGIQISVDKNAPGKAVVLIYNWDNDVIWKDAIKKDKGMQKTYILNTLDNGNYTVEVLINKQMVRRTAHVYYKGDAKMVTIRG
jgi:hypothetical protein